jgi:uracil-DNA glycosylase
VIIGQDPYYTPNTAVGRAFGVKGDKIPPSLINIKKEIKRSLNQDLMDYTLEKWQNQGVLLLNTNLTTTIGLTGVHTELWKPFNQYLFDMLSTH